jgi:carbamoyl-phosphate synthase large subunit
VAVAHNVPLITTISGAAASVNGIEALLKEEVHVKSLQEYHRERKDSFKAESQERAER